MGARGPLPLPAKVLALRGSEDANKRARSELRVPPATNLKPPAGMTPTARKCWKEIAPELQRRGLLSKIDTMALRMACEEFSLAQAFLRSMREQDPKKDPVVMITDVSHQNRRSRDPASLGWTTHASNFKAYLREFGMTPSSRARLDVGQLFPVGLEDESEHDDFDFDLEA